MLNRLERYIFYIFLFSIPFQARKILYFEGWRFNEWQSISVYATDVLLGVLFLFWLFGYLAHHKFSIFNFQFSIKSQLSIFQKPDFYLILFLIISAISIKNSDSYLISWFQWIKLVEFSVFYWYLSHYAFKKFGIFNSFTAIMAGGLFQAVIAIIQFLKQSSIGLKYFGESIVNVDLPGIASFYLPTGEKIIRAYGTTPHPNVLAAFFLVSIFCFYFIYFYSRLHSEHEPFADNWDRFFIVSYAVTLFAFFTTFSRTIIFIWFFAFCLRSIVVGLVKHYRVIFGTKEGRARIKVILIASFAVIVLFGSLYYNEIISRLTIDGGDQSVQLRSFYSEEALSGSFNFFGIGIGNFINWLVERNPYLSAYAYQPVHNIFLLLYSETGILGLSAFIGFLVFLLKDFIVGTKLKKSYHFSLLFLFISVIFIGFFDHLFLTLQQGRLVLWLILGVLTFYSKGDTIKE